MTAQRTSKKPPKKATAETKRASAKTGLAYFTPKSPRRGPEPTPKMRRALLRDGLRPNELRDQAFRRVIRSIPKGKVATYGQIAAAAGYPLYHRAVARLLRNDPPNSLPWQRVLGAGGEIKLRLDSAMEQRFRLELEGVTFSGKRVNLRMHQHKFRTWES